MLRELTTLAKHADTLTDAELRARLLGCWARLTQVCRHDATPLERSVEMGDTSPAEPSPLTPGEALAKLFLDNANHGRHAANDVLVEELLKRRRTIQTLANPNRR